MYGGKIKLLALTFIFIKIRMSQQGRPLKLDLQKLSPVLVVYIMHIYFINEVTGYIAKIRNENN